MFYFLVYSVHWHWLSKCPSTYNEKRCQYNKLLAISPSKNVNDKSFKLFYRYNRSNKEPSPPHHKRLQVKYIKVLHNSVSNLQKNFMGPFTSMHLTYSKKKFTITLIRLYVFTKRVASLLIKAVIKTFHSTWNNHFKVVDIC